MTPDGPLTPTSSQAREQLAAADQLAGVTARRGATVGATTTAAVGVLVAAALAAAAFFGPERPLAFTVSFVLYGILLAALMVWHHRSQVVAQRGFGKAYTRSFIATIVLYAIGIAMLRSLSWPWMTAYCVLVALPMVVTGARMLASARAGAGVGR